jgi:hypothetical protein
MVAAVAVAVHFPPHCLRCETGCLKVCRTALLLLLQGLACWLVELKMVLQLLLLVQQLPDPSAQKYQVYCLRQQQQQRQQIGMLQGRVKWRLCLEQACRV